MKNKEVLLANATVLDGRGGPAEKADVLINGERISAIGDIPPSLDRQSVDCTGFHIAPGFIDVHSHGDKEVLQHLPNKVLQGVTSEIVGNCGYSLFPTQPNPEGIKLTGEIFDGEPEEGMSGSADYFSALEAAGTRVNVVALTGHVALRIYAMKVKQTPSDEEFRVMERKLDECLASGSIGLSSGLNCLPSSFANPGEIARLCGQVKKHGAYYTSHMRDYKFKVIEAVDEAIEVGRAAEVPVQISHMQVIGKKNWDKLDIAIEHIERASQDGIDIAMDAYPYLAGSCSLTQFLPGWCQSGGLPQLLDHLSTPSAYQRIAGETDDGMSNTWDDLVICEVNFQKDALGKSIGQIALERNKSPQEVALDLLVEENGLVYVISFNSNETNLRKILTHRLTSIITDGMVLEGMSHPRTFGTYPKFFGEYVIEKKWMPLEAAVVKTSALPAWRFGLKERGTIEVGNFADLVVFDTTTIGTQADYSNPMVDPMGIHHVLVNGEFALQAGQLTDVKAGKALRHNA